MVHEGGFRRSVSAVCLLLALLLAWCSGCGGRGDPGDGGDNGSTDSISTSTAIDRVDPSTTARTVERPTFPDERFYRLARGRLEAALAEGVVDVDFTPLFREYEIAGDLMPELLDRIYLEYQDILQTTSDYFYMNGSFASDYDAGDDGLGRVDGLTLRIQYWLSLAELSATERAEYVAAVRAEAERWARDLRATSPEPGEVLAELHDRLARHITYDYDSESQAGWALLRGRTICGGYARAFQLICDKLGYPCRVVEGEANGSGHIWNQVMVDGRWHHVDVTMDDVLPEGCENASARHQYLLRSDSAMRETHAWTPDRYPACPTDNLLYFSANDLIAADRRGLADRVEAFAGSIDLHPGETYLLEVAYRGDDPPDVEEFSSLVEEALAPRARTETFEYQAGVMLGVAFLEVWSTAAP